MNYFLKYYGLDWVAAVLVIIGIYLIGNKKRSGFLFSMLGVVANFLVSVIIDSVPYIALNIILFTLQLRGYIKWGRN